MERKNGTNKTENKTQTRKGTNKKGITSPGKRKKTKPAGCPNKSFGTVGGKGSSTPAYRRWSANAKKD